MLFKILLVLSFPLILYGQNKEKDGYLWDELNERDKILFTGGYIYGMTEMGSNLSYVFRLREDTLSSQIIELVAISMLPKDKKIIQLVEGLNDFYSDYKNKHIGISSGFQVVYMILEGKSEDEIEQQLRNYRMPPDSLRAKQKKQMERELKK